MKTEKWIFASALFLFTATSYGNELGNPTCSQYEYIKIGMTDGSSAKAKLFASVPCKFVSAIERKHSENVEVKGKNNQQSWQAFRYRIEEKPGAKGFTKFEYLGIADASGSRNLVISLTEGKLKTLQSTGLYLENTRSQDKHGLMILTGEKSAQEIEKLNVNPDAIDSYVKNHLVLIANPESTKVNEGH